MKPGEMALLVIFIMGPMSPFRLRHPIGLRPAQADGMAKREGAALFCRAGTEVATNKVDHFDPRILARSQISLVLVRVRFLRRVASTAVANPNSVNVEGSGIAFNL